MTDRIKLPGYYEIDVERIGMENIVIGFTVDDTEAQRLKRQIYDDADKVPKLELEIKVLKDSIQNWNRDYKRQKYELATQQSLLDTIRNINCEIKLQNKQLNEKLAMDIESSGAIHERFEDWQESQRDVI